MIQMVYNNCYGFVILGSSQVVLLHHVFFLCLWSVSLVCPWFQHQPHLFTFLKPSLLPFIGSLFLTFFFFFLFRCSYRRERQQALCFHPDTEYPCADRHTARHRRKHARRAQGMGVQDPWGHLDLRGQGKYTEIISFTWNALTLWV